MPNQELQEPLEQRWVVLDNLVKHLNKKYDVPEKVFKNLQYSRSLISYYLQILPNPIGLKNCLELIQCLMILN